MSASWAVAFESQNALVLLMLENKVNQTSFKATRAKLAEHPIEQVGAKLRDMMPWIKQRALVDKSKN
jgi:ketol-acid reductoisomerase